MEPRIQYAKTEDGVSIAFSTLGEGMPFVHMPAVFSHLQLDWEIPELRSWDERLAKKWQIVRYDARGSGLSDRDVTDFSLDAGVLDLEAVMDRLGLERFVLWAPLFSGPASIAYAVRHPERVSHLILWNAGARTTDFTGGPQAQALVKLADADWEMFTETLARVAFGWSAGEEARRFAAVIRESVTQEWLQAFMAAPDVDVTELLPQVRSPSLVLSAVSPRSPQWIPPEVSPRGYRMPAWPSSRGPQQRPGWVTRMRCIAPSTSSWARVRRRQRRASHLKQPPFTQSSLLTSKARQP